MESQPQNPEFRINPENFTHEFVKHLGEEFALLKLYSSCRVSVCVLCLFLDVPKIGL